MIRPRTPLPMNTLLSPVLLVSLLLMSCAPSAGEAAPPSALSASPGAAPALAGAGPAVVDNAVAPAAGTAAIDPGGRGQGTGLRLRISEGSENAPAAQPAPLAAGQPLSDAEAQEVLARLPALQPGAADQQSFALPKSSLPRLAPARPSKRRSRRRARSPRPPPLFRLPCRCCATRRKGTCRWPPT